MGILNVTPDSFADGGRYATADAAVRQGMALFECGAQIVDVGGESTRPGGGPRIEVAEECRRIAPVLEALRARGAGPLSIDTSRAAVARAALDAGADMVNDISGFRFDPELPALVAARGVPAVIMHLRGTHETMHAESTYADVASEIGAELQDAIARSERFAVRREQLILDPGIGFSKRADQSLTTLRDVGALAALDRPILVGPSRKSFIGAVLNRPVEERLMGTAAAVAASILAGAHIVRVHDVAEMGDVARMCDAILAGAEAA
jgi:dihydropteroate synthase